MNTNARDRFVSPTYETGFSIKNHLLSHDRHVTLYGQSESGYSTNTSGDESWGTDMTSQITQSHFARERGQTCPKLKLDQNSPDRSAHNELQQMIFDSGFCNLNKDMDSDVMHTSPSPLYYDPLHLQKVSLEPRKILDNTKNNHVSIDHMEDDEPPGVLGFHPIHPDTGVSLELSDPHHKSAFIPVASYKKFTNTSGLSQTSLELFTPVKGPSVVDCVTSGLKKADVIGKPDPKDVAFQLNLESIQSKCCSTNHKRYNKHTPTNPQTQQDPSVIPASSPRRAIGVMTKDIDLVRIKNTNNVEYSESSRSKIENQITRDEVFANSAARLRHFLDNRNAKHLKKFLLEQLKSKDPTIIAALSIVIPESVAAPTESHRVRYHENFNPHKRSRCLIPHPESMVFKIRQDGEGGDLVCQCCKTAFRLLKVDPYKESTNATLTGHCYSGQHTIDPLRVNRKIKRGTSELCIENKCIQVYV